MQGKNLLVTVNEAEGPVLGGEEVEEDASHVLARPLGWRQRVRQQRLWHSHAKSIYYKIIVVVPVTNCIYVETISFE